MLCYVIVNRISALNYTCTLSYKKNYNTIVILIFFINLLFGEVNFKYYQKKFRLNFFSSVI
jgi:hypothetical protein